MTLQTWTCSKLVSTSLCYRPVPAKLRTVSYVQKAFVSSSPVQSFRPLEALPTIGVDTFREQYFQPERPAVLPRSHFKSIPAVTKWFKHNDVSTTEKHRSTARLNTEYLLRYASHALVPLELTRPAEDPGQITSKGNGSENQRQPSAETMSFVQFDAPLSLFLEWMQSTETRHHMERIYLAQCQLYNLPSPLQRDLEAPDLVRKAGLDDIYDTNLWMGRPPTYTPLHRDPNPNLFVQLAGQKVVRLIAPAMGQTLFDSIRAQLGQSGGKHAAAFRGAEMMQGRERALLEDAVWSESDTDEGIFIADGYAFEAHLGAGDGLFIPKGWWHSIKGVGDGVTASVSVLLLSFCCDRSRY
ncbi:Clavaminate synthase-like protein [Penicillium diatomitis]|uniref:Clavaminate synthase-like protein n=1 Tax=Penicillium diatomitis TaxID=2819901 RepID=A0A9W9XMG6_9EURO|nr:Clavaminate synthase-like protein [Penicillium diatomitis]KAJ5495674.1 Clavaminate synthase-like protein [Penicillium diatomitis]